MRTVDGRGEWGPVRMQGRHRRGVGPRRTRSAPAEAVSRSGSGAAGVVEDSIGDRVHLQGLSGEADTEVAHPLVLRLHIVDGELGERDAGLDERVRCFAWPAARYGLCTPVRVPRRCGFIVASAPWRAIGTVTKHLRVGWPRRTERRRAVQRRQRQGRPGSGTSGPQGRSQMDWVGLMVVSLPGLAALAALLFTWMQVGQASKELRISEQGQITNRFNAAVTNLGSESMDVRLGGIYGLERIMQDSVRDHSTVVSVLTAYVRRHAPLPRAALEKKRSVAADVSPPTDIEAVMNVLANRPLEADEVFRLDVSRTDLRGLRSGQGGSKFAAIVFQESDLTGANLNGANLNGANLNGAILRRSSLIGAHLSGASLADADLNSATLNEAELTSAELTDARLTGAKLNGALLSGALLERTVFRAADLNGAKLTYANLADASLVNAHLTYSDLTYADLSDADLTKADLTGANLTGANLTGARLTGAKLKGARGLPPSRR